MPSSPAESDRLGRVPSGSGSADSVRRQTMEERYGVQRPRQRILTVSALAGVAVVALGWLLWVAWTHSTPDVTGELRSFSVVSAHQIDVLIDIRRTEGDAVTCLLKAQAADHSIVAEDEIEVPAGAAGTLVFEASIETEREATTATVSDCR